jgi:nitrate reductase NapAB chaperone NapD
MDNGKAFTVTGAFISANADERKELLKQLLALDGISIDTYILGVLLTDLVNKGIE